MKKKADGGTMADMEINQLIARTPDTCGGRARVAGRRIPVSSIYRWFLNGCGPEDIQRREPGDSTALMVLRPTK